MQSGDDGSVGVPLWQLSLDGAMDGVGLAV